MLLLTVTTLNHAAGHKNVFSELGDVGEFCKLSGLPISYNLCQLA